jgi:CO dehydrogenase/acetyl-CoA synthase beta subunit
MDKKNLYTPPHKRGPVDISFPPAPHAPVPRKRREEEEKMRKEIEKANKEHEEYVELGKPENFFWVLSTAIDFNDLKTLDKVVKCGVDLKEMENKTS